MYKYEIQKLKIKESNSTSTCCKYKSVRIQKMRVKPKTKRKKVAQGPCAWWAPDVIRISMLDAAEKKAVNFTILWTTGSIVSSFTISHHYWNRRTVIQSDILIRVTITKISLPITAHVYEVSYKVREILREYILCWV